MTNNIYAKIQNYIDEGGAAMVTRDDDGDLGVLFRDEGEFIPFSDLGYSSQLGFYRPSRFPDVVNEAHKPKIEETFFTSGRITDHDGYEYLALIATDFTDGFVIGSWDSVEKVYHLLGRLLETRQPDEEIDEFDERLGASWLSVSDAALKYGVSVATVRRACDKGTLKGAKKQGDMWRFPENHFRAWYHHRYQPEKGKRGNE